ncbi:hypothetical protein, partial [Enterococcus faecalis]|uniref:hypothetical protein n=1 Tax=Enterococcus faecalis TaxID=1351 RepID=UPI004041CA2D
MNDRRLSPSFKNQIVALREFFPAGNRPIGILLHKPIDSLKMNLAGRTSNIKGLRRFVRVVVDVVDIQICHRTGLHDPI